MSHLPPAHLAGPATGAAAAVSTAVLTGASGIAAAPPGWYGKLAALGDFASRRLPQPWVQACDQWLSECLLSSRAELGADWLDLYLTAPLWRFAWAPGVIDAQWWFGVLMPSCDNVGRYFPLLVAQAGRSVPQQATALAELERWYLHIANAALQTLDGRTAVDAFEAALALAPACANLAGVPADPASGASSSCSRPVALTTAESACEPMLRHETLSGWLARAAALALQRQLQGCSLWWSWSPDEPAGPVRVLTGLPQPTQFSAMLDGRW